MIQLRCLYDKFYPAHVTFDLSAWNAQLSPLPIATSFGSNTLVMSGYSDFSPYQPSPDEDRTARIQKEKHKSKNGKGKGKQSSQPSHSQYSSYQAGADGPPHLYQPSSSLLEEGLFSDAPSIGAAKGSQGGVRVNKYQTKVPIRVDIEAALTYVLGPITGKVNMYLSGVES